MLIVKLNFFLILVFLFNQAGFARQPLAVNVVPIQKTSEYKNKIFALGTLEKNPYKLYFETAGFVKKIFFKKIGSEIKKGQLLATLKTHLIENKIQQAKQKLNNTKRKLTRAKKLILKQSISHDELDNLEHDFSLHVLELKQLKNQLADYSMFAPFDALILDSHLDFPQAISTVTPVYTIKARNKPWIVTAQITAKEMTSVKVGNIVDVQFNAISGKVFTGRLTTINQVAHKEDSMVDIDIALSQDDQTWFAEMKAKVQIYATNNLNKNGVYKIPLIAFATIDKNKGEIYTVNTKNSHAKKLLVDIHTINKKNAIVTTDLSAFNHVIISGLRHLKDDLEIQLLTEVNMYECFQENNTC